MSKSLVIVGCGGFGREVWSLVQALNAVEPCWSVAGFVDDAPGGASLEQLRVLGAEVIGSVADLAERRHPYAAVLAVGSPAARAMIASTLAGSGVEYARLVHPDATIGRSVTIGAGSIVAAGARLSTNITLGQHVHVDQNVTIGHDTEVGSYSRLNPQACVSGSVSIGEGVLVGANATILPGLAVGDGAVVGAVACVTRGVDPGTVVMGVPARAGREQSRTIPTTRGADV